VACAMLSRKASATAAMRANIPMMNREMQTLVGVLRRMTQNGSMTDTVVHKIRGNPVVSAMLSRKRNANTDRGSREDSNARRQHDHDPPKSHKIFPDRTKEEARSGDRDGQSSRSELYRDRDSRTRYGDRDTKDRDRNMHEKSPERSRGDRQRGDDRGREDRSDTKDRDRNGHEKSPERSRGDRQRGDDRGREDRSDIKDRDRNGYEKSPERPRGDRQRGDDRRREDRSESKRSRHDRDSGVRYERRGDEEEERYRKLQR
uniref:Uncharacterized protein n=2 Tax=Aegilops tauschii subsp. strangulata TaxID=200361 RepID=A0A453AXE9_AEGTS